MMDSIVRALSLSMVLRGVRLLLNVGLVGLLGRHLGAVNMGMLFGAQATVAILLSLAELGFSRITVRELARCPENMPEILGTAIVGRLIVGCLLFGITLTTVLALKLSPEAQWIVLAQALLLVTHGLSEIGAWLEAKGRIADSWRAQFIGFSVGAVLIVIGVLLGAPVTYFVLPYLIDCWVVSLLIWRYFVKSGESLFALQLSGMAFLRMMKESWPEMLTQLATLSLFRIDTVMIQWFAGAAAAGTYGVAVRISEVLYFLPMALAGVVAPKLFARREGGQLGSRAEFINYFSGSWLLAIVGAVTVSVVSWPLMTGLMGAEFVESAAILQVHAWAFIPYAIGVARTQHLVACGLLWLNLPSVLIALVVNVILNWAWIPQWKGEGAAWATVVSYGLAWMVTTVVLPQLRESARLQAAGLVKVPFMIQKLHRKTMDFCLSSKAKTK